MQTWPYLPRLGRLWAPYIQIESLGTCNLAPVQHAAPRRNPKGRARVVQMCATLPAEHPSSAGPLVSRIDLACNHGPCLLLGLSPGDSRPPCPPPAANGAPFHRAWLFRGLRTATMYTVLLDLYISTMELGSAPTQSAKNLQVMRSSLCIDKRALGTSCWPDPRADYHERHITPTLTLI